MPTEKNMCLHFNSQEDRQLDFVKHEIHAARISINITLQTVNVRNHSTPAGRNEIKEQIANALQCSDDINNHLNYWQMTNNADYFKNACMHPQNLWGRFYKPNSYFQGIIRSKNLRYSVKKIGVSIIQDYIGYGVINAIANIMLDNAIKYALEGSEILCEFEYDTAENLIISMENEGPYVAEEEIESLFACGIRGENASQTGTRGSGYGLNFLKTLVEAHGGQAVIETSYSGLVNGIKYGTFRLSVALPPHSEREEEYDDYDDDDFEE